MPRNTLAVMMAVLLAVSLVGVGAIAAPVAAEHDDEDCSFPFEGTDLTGTNVTLDEPAEDVVLLDAASTQTFWEIGADDRVVGMPVEEWTAYLDGSEDKADVTDGQTVLVERVIELEPDLVVAPNFADEDTVEQLRDAGLTVYQLEFEESFEDIYAKTTLFGHFVGDCEAASNTVEETQNEVEEIRTAVEGEDEPRVLYYFFGFTAGDGTFIGDLVETAGGENVAATAGVEGFVEISDEVIVEQDPEWIVAPSHAGMPVDEEPLASTTAAELEQTLVVDENLVSQAAPRVVEPLRAMAEAFHPEAFEAETPADADADEEQETPEEATEPADADADADGSGFGIAVAVSALLAAALLARRP